MGLTYFFVILLLVVLIIALIVCCTMDKSDDLGYYEEPIVEERVVVTHQVVELPSYDAHNSSRHLRPFNDHQEEEEIHRRAAESRYNPNEYYGHQ